MEQMTKLTVEALNLLHPDGFVAVLGGVYEHSPWVAEAVVHQRPFAACDDVIAAMRSVVEQADDATRLALIQAHPDLAGKLAIAGELSEASAGEQSGLGLDRLSPYEFELFQELNSTYRARHEFPFVICARLTDKGGVVEAFSRRTPMETTDEVANAIGEIHHIARLRLLDILE